MTTNADLADQIEEALWKFGEAVGAHAYCDALADIGRLVAGNSAAILTALRSEPAAGDVERVAVTDRVVQIAAEAYCKAANIDCGFADMRVALEAALAAMAGETGGE